MLADSFFTTENTEDTALFYHAKEILFFDI